MINIFNNIIDQYHEEIIKLSHKIHQSPEIGYEEYRSSEILVEYLRKIGYKVEKGIDSYETAFVASLGKKTKKGKTIAILAEYDALPNIGHACGHNVIAAVACGVASAYSEILKSDFDGELKIIGTPAEENGGGKIELIELGVFDSVDYAMMIHPGSRNIIKRGGTALVEFNITYEGRRAHSSAPENGINALKAIIATFNGIDSMRSEFPKGINVNGIIKNGGEASNIIPDYALAEFTFRGERLVDLKDLKGKIEQVIKSVEVLTGAKSSCSFEKPYAERYPNHVMAEAFKEIFDRMGETVSYPQKHEKLGSSDIGNVSLLVPTIHPYVKIGDNLQAHTLSFTEASKSIEADRMIIKASKALSELTYRLFTEFDFQIEVMNAFKKQVPNYKNFIF